MTTKPENPPAFPIQEVPGLQFPTEHFGVTMLDYFAAKALQGLNANSDHPLRTSEEIAELAYSDAKAMLIERQKYL